MKATMGVCSIFSSMISMLLILCIKKKPTYRWLEKSRNVQIEMNMTFVKNQLKPKTSIKRLRTSFVNMFSRSYFWQVDGWGMWLKLCTCKYLIKSPFRSRRFSNYWKSKLVNVFNILTTYEYKHSMKIVDTLFSKAFIWTIRYRKMLT